MSNPVRIQRRRAIGWRMPENTVYVGRGSQWGNPFVIGRDGTAAECIKKYKDASLPYSHRGPRNSTTDFMISEHFLKTVHQLRGKNLACWCKLDQPCHADWLLELAASNITLRGED